MNTLTLAVEGEPLTVSSEALLLILEQAAATLDGMDDEELEAISVTAEEAEEARALAIRLIAAVMNTAGE